MSSRGHIRGGFSSELQKNLSIIIQLTDDLTRGLVGSSPSASALTRALDLARIQELNINKTAENISSANSVLNQLQIDKNQVEKVQQYLLDITSSTHCSKCSAHPLIS